MSAPEQNSIAVDASLWFNSFYLLYTELENLPLASDPPPPLAEKIKENHAWFLDTVNCFKSPNQKSRDALNSGRFTVGNHEFSVKRRIKDLALNLSSVVCLDEVQSYILVERSIKRSPGLGDANQRSLQEIVLQYYIERQCLLKCTRLLINHALYVECDMTSGKGNAIRDEVLGLISYGFESKLIYTLEGLLSSCNPEQMDVDLFILWAEETLMEDNLVLDILFLLFYESSCTCTAATWKTLCLIYKGMISGYFNFGKLCASDEAVEYIYQAKVQMLFVLLETLDLENLLQMIHDEIPFREGSKYSLNSIQEMDAVISSFDVFEMKELGPLVLAWAVFLCLICSLPGKEENAELMEIDHSSYVRLSFEVESLSYFLEVLRSDVIKCSDGPTAGYKSIMRTFISSFIASYEINIQPEDRTLKLILTLLGEIYRGEEALCIQFWDRDSIIDGPVRCLLCSLEGEFPHRTIELISLLSALCEGSWPAECVYNFLDKSVGISTLLDIDDVTMIDEDSQTVLLNLPLVVPGVGGLTLPSKTQGHDLRMVGERTALVRWEHTESALFVLLLRLAQERDLYNSKEVLVVLDLLSRLVSFNMGVCHALMRLNSSLDALGSYGFAETQSKIQIDTVEILCNVVKHLAFSCNNTSAVAMGVSILTKMLKCSPSHVSMIVIKANLFDLTLKTIVDGVDTDLISSSSVVSGRLAKMLLIDCEESMFSPFTISVLDFTCGLLEAGVESDFVLALVVFCLQYVFVNHENWKYKVKQNRWLVTLKVLGVLKMSILSIPYLTKVGATIRDIVLSDPSIHNTLFSIVCVTSQSLERLYLSRLHNFREIEGLQNAICLVLDILLAIYSIYLKDASVGMPVLYQAILSPATKPIPVITALASLLAYFQSPAIQVGAAGVLSMLFVVADNSGQFLSGNAIFCLGHKQILQLRHSLDSIIQESMGDEDLFVTTVKLLTTAAHCQPAFLVAIFSSDPSMELQINGTGVKDLTGEMSFSSLTSKTSGILVDMVLSSLERFRTLLSRNPRVIASILDFLKALWQQAAQYMDVLKAITASNKFWVKMSESILMISDMKVPFCKNLTEVEAQSIVYEYRCQSTAFDIFSLAMFLHNKLLHGELLRKQADQSSEGRIGFSINPQKLELLNVQHVKDILSSWSNSMELSKLVKLASASVYDADILLHAKVSSSFLVAHIIVKITSGDAGSLSVAFTEKMHNLFKQLTEVPAFSDLVSQYSQRGYSEGTELHSLIVNDLYYHLEGVLEGRGIDHGSFKELSRFLADSNLFQEYEKLDNDFLVEGNDVLVFDLVRLRHDMGLDMWNHSGWKSSKAIAESMFIHLQDFNSMMLLLSARISTLRALIMVLSLNESPKESTTTSSRTHEDIISSCIDYVCQELRGIVGIIIATPDAPPMIFDFLAGQAELLLCLLRNMQRRISLRIFKLLCGTCVFGLKAMSESNRFSGKVKVIMKLLLKLQLLALENIVDHGSLAGASDTESVETFGEVSNTCLAILPVLCSCSVISDQRILSLVTIDLILRRCLSPSTWFPVVHEHIQMQHIMMSLNEKTYLDSISEILKFLLTLARVREGAELLIASGLLSSLKVLFANLSDRTFFPVDSLEMSPLVDNVEKHCYTWGLGAAVLTSVICSLGGSPCVFDVLHSIIPFIFSEKAHLISYRLSAPDFSPDRRDNNGSQFEKRQSSLSGFRETEHTLALICVLANYRDYWTKAMKEVESELRERSIHLLAFISRGSLYTGESHAQTIPFLCPPRNKEEIDCCKKPAFVNSKAGWFVLTALGCFHHANRSRESSMSSVIVIKELPSRMVDRGTPTHFSDTVAVQIYRISFLLLKFLCLQADNAARKAEELGFVDLSHFPELPMPDILHGLQDQAIAIVSELCGANNFEQMQEEIKGLCLLLLEVTEMALYLELCVSQICGIRPVLGRVEDFSKEIKSFFRVAEAHAFLKPSVKHLKQIISSVYPGLVHGEGIW